MRTCPPDVGIDRAIAIAGLSVFVGAVARPEPSLPCSADAPGEVPALLHAADTALYAAKRAGRSRVRISRSPGTVAALPAPPVVPVEQVAGH